MKLVCLPLVASLATQEARTPPEFRVMFFFYSVSVTQLTRYSIFNSDPPYQSTTVHSSCICTVCILFILTTCTSHTQSTLTNGTHMQRSCWKSINACACVSPSALPRLRRMRFAASLSSACAIRSSKHSVRVIPSRPFSGPTPRRAGGHRAVGGSCAAHRAHGDG